MSVDFGAETTPNDVVTVIATEPLTDNEQWQRLQAGELVVFNDGEVVCDLSEAS
jgi:glutamine amidotransferase